MKIISNNFEFLKSKTILEYDEKELLKSAYDFFCFIQMILFYFPWQLLSLKECLKDIKIKTIRKRFQFLLENDLFSVYNDIVSAALFF